MLYFIGGKFARKSVGIVVTLKTLLTLETCDILEILAKKASRKGEEGEDEKNAMKNTVKLREIERETKQLNLIYNG